MVFNPDPEAYPMEGSNYEPVLVKEGATGFMMAERSVFEEYGKLSLNLVYTRPY